MEKPKEDIKQIGLSISSHASQENKEGIANRAFARAKCVLSSANTPEREWTFWLTNKEDYQGMRMQRDFTGSGTVYQLGRKTALQSSDGQPVYKNTRLGEVLTKYVSGTHSYSAPGGLHTLEIINRSSYKPTGSDPSEVEIRMADDPAIYRYQRLSHLLNAAKAEEARLKKQIEGLKRIEEEKARLARELEEKKAREEQARIEALRIQKEEEERKMREEIARIEQAQAQLIEQEKAVRSFMRKNVMLRSQHLLDQYQEDAKRSHIYDNIPIVIDGGPGTGKTTTMIQRLKFLLSYQALEEYEAPITREQLEELTDETERDNHWLFFSPTELLLQYLRDNMREEGLRANDRNTRVVSKFRNKIMRDYQLFNPSKDGPFKDYKPSEGESALIRDAKKAILEFERFIIDYCNKTFSQRASLKTDEHLWHQDALRIKSQFARVGKVKDIDALMRLFNSLHDNEKANVKSWSDELRELLKASAMTLQRIVSKDEDVTAKLNALFEKWRKERVIAEETDEDEDAIIDDDEDDTEEVSISRQEFDAQLFSELKKLIKKIGLKKFDSKIKLGKHSQEVLDIVSNFIDEEELDVETIGSIALFVRNYASLCRGIESNIIGVIPKLYKAFRKSQLEGKIYKTDLLKKIITKDSNKHLHPDEQNLLLGFINEMLHSIYRKSRVRFDNLKHKYARAFKESVRNVIGVDEATDYSLLDYYFMISFRHYTFCSITLCGDIMQGLNDNGIKSWDELKKFILPNLEVKSLNISYRQLPTLLDVARELYHDDLGIYHNYKSEMAKSEKEPKPLMLISDDEDEKAEWISMRIREILDIYEELPSIAIFVGDDVNIPRFIERINDLDLINGIDIVDCSGDRQLQNKEMVRVFRISEVKGMEFEAAFFYDIDEAIFGHNEKLMRRFLYVGISRATSHLAATMKDRGSVDFIKYFETEDTSWEL